MVTAEKILLALRARYLIDEHELHVTGSIGIVTYPEDGTGRGNISEECGFCDVPREGQRARDDVGYAMSTFEERANNVIPM